MDVAVSDLRSNLSSWLGRAREGDEIIVTERGVPVARIIGVDAIPELDRLTEVGIIGRPPRTPRPEATGASKPHVRRSLADIVSEQRG